MEEKIVSEMFGCLSVINSHVHEHSLNDKYAHPTKEARAEYYKLTGIFEGYWNTLQIVKPGSFMFLNPVNLFGIQE
jgi:hypothetical protein